MPARVSEAFVLQTWPFREGDLIVSFLTRDFGKLRGVARAARRPKSPYGAGLERLSQVRMAYFQKENRELVRIDSCEMIQSQFGLSRDFASACALDYIAEVSEQLLPAAEPGEKYFRLLIATLECLRSGLPGAVWRAATYFSLWTVRLTGLLPDLDACIDCGAFLEAEDKSWFGRHTPGLHCQVCRKPNSWELSAESRWIALEMLRTPITQLAERNWTQSSTADLRRLLSQQMEAHIERKLITLPVLEAAA
jgi:DNA repair protein RecO (recombination protein O)